MKRLLSLLKGLSLLICLSTLTSCPVSGGDKNYVEPSRAITNRRLELAQLSLEDDYKVEPTEVLDDLALFLDVSKGSANSGNGKRSLNSEAGYKFSIVQKSSINLEDFEKAKGSKHTRSAENFENDEVEFSLVDVDSVDGDQKGFALVSDDKRIGTVLMFADSVPFVEDISDDGPMQCLVSLLSEYIESTKQLWDDINETDYEQLRQLYGITDEQIADAKRQYENGALPRKMFGTSYSAWSKPIIKEPVLRTSWGQDDFSALVSQVHEECVPAGCGPLAAAQIMAYYQYPSNTAYSATAVEQLQSKYSAAANWDGQYNWPEILRSSAVGIRDANCLLFEIGRRAWTHYNPEGSGTWMPMLLGAMDTMGYRVFPKTDYSFDKVRKSLDSNYPVLMEGFTSSRYIGLPFWKWIEWGEGTGHAFVCDGYMHQERTKTTYVFWVPVKCTENNDYVHLNPGWNGTSNGWYKSGIFNMLDGYSLETSSITRKGVSSNNYDFSEAVHIWTDIRPKNY